MGNIEEKIRELVEPIINQQGYELFDVEYEKEGSEYYLRILVENIDLDGCVKLTHEINPLIDELEEFTQEFYLDISSPGAERTIRNWEEVVEAIGSHIYVKTYQKVNDIKEVTGTLLSASNDVIEIEYLDKTRKIKIEIPYELVAKIRYAVKL